MMIDPQAYEDCIYETFNELHRAAVNKLDSEEP
jgi:hypothetical protein